MGFMIISCLLLLTIVGFSYANPGEYVPRSYYLIDRFGHQSPLVPLRTKRDIYQLPELLRVRRGGGYATSSATSSVAAGGGGTGNGCTSCTGSSGGSGHQFDAGLNFDNLASNLAQNLAHLENLAGGNGGNGAFATSSSSSSSGGGHGSGYGGNYGGLGSGQNAGYNGPVLFSRVGEAQGQGVHVSGHAQGEKGAFASSSSSIDDQGKIKYSVQSGKY